MAAMAQGLRRSLAVPRPHEWVLLAVALGLTWRYFWLMDDAFIYFRYADNLLFLDRGLVMNGGEYVEGYSSPLWMLLVVAARTSELDYWTLVRLSSLVFAGMFGAMLIVINRRMVGEGPIVNLPLALFAGHYGMLSHFSSGLETPLVQLWAALFALGALSPGQRLLQILLGCAPMVRPDMGLPCLLFFAYAWIGTRRFPLAFVLGGLLVNGTWLVFRVSYYADILPNTFYLKAGREWAQGLHYVRNATMTHYLPIVVPVVGLLYAAIRARLPRDGAARFFMLVSGCASLIYVARIGGDMLYYRFAAFALALIVIAGAGVPEAVVARLVRPGRWAFTAAALGLTIYAFSLACYPHQLKGHPLSDPKTRHDHWISDAMWHRRHAHLRMESGRAEDDAKRLERYRNATPSRLAQRRILVTGWCRDAYLAFDRYVIHELGLTDAILARIRMRPGRPGHKALWDHARLLEQAQLRAKLPRGRGMYRRALHKRQPIEWIANNLDAIEEIEARIYNEHDLATNLRLVSRPIGRLPP